MAATGRDRGGYSGGSGNFKGNGGFKREFRKNDGERSSADRGGRSFSDRSERELRRATTRKPRHEGGFKPPQQVVTTSYRSSENGPAL